MARYIDADKFLECEIKRCGCVPLVGSCTTDNESLAYQLAKVSTADVVEVKHGEWIWLEGNLYECSECPNKTEVDEKMNQPLYAYCPYCGTRMDGRRDT